MRCGKSPQWELTGMEPPPRVPARDPPYLRRRVLRQRPDERSEQVGLFDEHRTEPPHPRHRSSRLSSVAGAAERVGAAVMDLVSQRGHQLESRGAASELNGIVHRARKVTA